MADPPSKSSLLRKVAQAAMWALLGSIGTLFWFAWARSSPTTAPAVGGPALEVLGFMPVFSTHDARRGCEYPSFAFHGVFEIQNRSPTPATFSHAVIDGDVSGVFQLITPDDANEPGGRYRRSVRPKYAPGAGGARHYSADPAPPFGGAHLSLVSFSVEKEAATVGGFETSYIFTTFTEPSSTCLEGIRLGAAWMRPIDGRFFFVNRAPVFVLGLFGLAGGTVDDLIPEFDDGRVSVSAAIGTYRITVPPKTILAPKTVTADRVASEDWRRLYLYRQNPPPK